MLWLSSWGFFYIYNSTSNKIDKCNNKCKDCSLESNSKDLCISCNNSGGFYEIYNDSLNEPNFVNCSKNPIGYFLNGSGYYPCYNTCETCLNQGNESNNNCLTCKNNYVFKFDFDFINKNNC